MKNSKIFFLLTKIQTFETSTQNKMDQSIREEFNKGKNRHRYEMEFFSQFLYVNIQKN